MTNRLRPLAQLLVESAEGVTGALPSGLDDVRADTLMVAGHMHRLRPAIRRRFRSAPEAPEALLRPLEVARHGQLVRQMQAAHDLGSIASIFGDSVRWVVAKGPILADTVWPHPDMREFSDLDVFIHPADFAAALRLLEDAGFAYVDRNWPEINRLARAELAMRGPSGFPLDLHWDISVSKRSRRVFRADLAGMLARRRFIVTGTGLTLPTFDTTDTVLYVAQHSAQSGANRLVWVADVLHATRAKGLNWQSLEERSQRAGMALPVALVLARVERTFDVRLPLPDALRRLAHGSWLGRVAAMRDTRHPFPGLPGDDNLSGAEYSSARRSTMRSVVAAGVQWAEVRVLEAKFARAGARDNPLDDDVPDPAAKRAYVNLVAGSAGSRG